jgi:hypothetical protein
MPKGLRGQARRRTSVYNLNVPQQPLLSKGLVQMLCRLLLGGREDGAVRHRQRRECQRRHEVQQSPHHCMHKCYCCSYAADCSRDLNCI